MIITMTSQMCTNGIAINFSEIFEYDGPGVIDLMKALVGEFPAV